MSEAYRRIRFSRWSRVLLIPDPEWISQANDLHAKIEAFREARIPLPKEEDPAGHPLMVGVDVARFGEDSSVLCYRRGPYVKGFRELGYNTRTTEVTGHVIRALKDRGLTPDNRRAYKIIVDGIGVGGGVVDELHDAGFPVNGCNVSAPPPAGTDEHLNIRAWIYWEVRNQLDEGTLALPPSDDLREELLAHSWSPNAKGKIQLAKKDAVRAELGRSPDFSDSLALTFAGSHQATRGGALGITL